MTTVNMHEAKTRLSQLVKEVEAGGEVVLSRRGRPVARIVAVADEAAGTPKGRRVPGSAKHLIGDVDPRAFDPMTDEELAEMGWPV